MIDFFDWLDDFEYSMKGSGDMKTGKVKQIESDKKAKRQKRKKGKVKK